MALKSKKAIVQAKREQWAKETGQGIRILKYLFNAHKTVATKKVAQRYRDIGSPATRRGHNHNHNLAGTKLLRKFSPAFRSMEAHGRDSHHG